MVFSKKSVSFSKDTAYLRLLVGRHDTGADTQGLVVVPTGNITSTVSLSCQHVERGYELTPVRLRKETRKRFLWYRDILGMPC